MYSLEMNPFGTCLVQLHLLANIETFGIHLRSYLLYGVQRESLRELTAPSYKFGWLEMGESEVLSKIPDLTACSQTPV